MDMRFHSYAPAVLLLVLASASACRGTEDSPTSPEPVRQLQTSITAEPVSARAEFLNSPVCSIRPAFGTRVTIIIGGRPGSRFRGFRFVFVDRFGTRTLPEVFPIPLPSTASTLLPSSSPISIPGFAALPSASPVSGALPFFVRFGCDLIPDGTLIITPDDPDEALELPEMRIRVGP